MMSTEEAVRQRYSAGACAPDAALCCPVAYDVRYLEAIPAEVLERDYGCGDPTPHVRPGDTVVDLGAGGGKVCFIAAQVAGPRGRVVGVDCNLEMLPRQAAAERGPPPAPRSADAASRRGRTPRRAARLPERSKGHRSTAR